MQTAAARYERTSAGTPAILIDCFLYRSLNTWIGGQAEVVVGAEIDESLAGDFDGRRAQLTGRFAELPA